ncbi:MAG TPA: NADH-ubiquinone oxidoreductase-F iron-sulfur binding region domain-containing protein [Planctomycetota bacterium]|nr:NADH-ubiquinone oxidoreductase-F iron-sulfur binding region domain-containing protein [Planctomycetota bacterium]
MSKNLSALAFRRGIDATLLEGFVQRAGEHGAVTPADARELAESALIGEAVTLGAASFYDFLKAKRPPHRARICNGTACLVTGRQAAVRQTLEAHLPPESIGSVCCLGRCHENDAFEFEGLNYSNRSPEHIATIVRASNGSPHTDTYAVGSNLTVPILTAPLPDLVDFYAPLGMMLQTPPDQLLAELQRSGLRGRGGAGFLVAAKWAACRAASGSPKYILCNADEGDPGAYSDRYLLEQRPHAVLFGMLAAGIVTGATAGVLYVRAEYPEACARIETALQELAALGWQGDNLQGSGFSFRCKMIKGAGAYICGEETALIASVEGARPEPRVRPPFPTEVGLFGRPTVINNVETLACIQPIFAQGGAAFARIGTRQSTGPKLTSLNALFRRPGVYEVAMGTSLRSVIDHLGGGLKVPVKALHIGGPLGGLVPRSMWDRLTFDFESFKANGFLLGHAGIVAIPETFPMIEYLAHLFEFTAAESCGKCFPCRLGSKRGHELLEQAAAGHRPIDRTLFADLLDTLEQGSLCALGGGLPMPIRNALTYFADELKPYFA